ncbi:hypothetical protein IWQ60_007147, partial [Tieghemiomyces parasiticus]
MEAAAPPLTLTPPIRPTETEAEARSPEDGEVNPQDQHDWLREEMHALGELKREAINSHFPDEWRMAEQASDVWVPAHLHPEIAPNEFQHWLDHHGSALGRRKSLQRRPSVLSRYSSSGEDLETGEGDSETAGPSNIKQVTAVTRQRTLRDDDSGDALVSPVDQPEGTGSAAGASPVPSFDGSLASDPGDGTWVIQTIQKSGLQRSKRSNLRRDSVLSEKSRRRRQMRKDSLSRSEDGGPAGAEGLDDESVRSPEAPSPPVGPPVAVTEDSSSSTMASILSEITARIDSDVNLNQEVEVPLQDPAELQSPFTTVTGVPVRTPSRSDPGRPPSAELARITLNTPATTDQTSMSTLNFNSDVPDLRLELDSPGRPQPSAPALAPVPIPPAKPSLAASTGKKSSAWSWLWGSDAESSPPPAPVAPANPTAKSTRRQADADIIRGRPSQSEDRPEPSPTPPNTLSKHAGKQKRASPISFLFSKGSKAKRAASGDRHSETDETDDDDDLDGGSDAPHPDSLRPATGHSADDLQAMAGGLPNRADEPGTLGRSSGGMASGGAAAAARYTNYNRYPIHIERAIYRLSHIKLANPRRPLVHQVLISNMMFWYLSIINPRANGPADYYAQPGDYGGEPAEAHQHHPTENGGYADYTGEAPEADQQVQYYQYGYSDGGAPAGEDPFSPTASAPHSLPASLASGQPPSAYGGGPGALGESGPQGKKSGGKSGKKGRRKQADVERRGGGGGGGGNGSRASAEVVAVRSPQYSRQKQQIYQQRPPSPSGRATGSGQGPYRSADPHRGASPNGHHHHPQQQQPSQQHSHHR